MLGTPAQVRGNNMAALTLTQMTQVAAVLAHNIQRPFLKENETGLKVNSANQLVIKLTTGNGNLGTNLVTSYDGTYYYVGLNPGDPCSGA
jgi:hypothetical protein